ncbi:sugar MFS transporter [Pedobacter sp. Hv1]|uniref:sugar MFS transporter n=1 Tax=Pedobacter sp. Hv1 TaxID=1740090 RepID=UPI0006D8C089|nr:sugar MFS transporter [Pedobacter sp. Hv1]KQC00191.1 MFS transporter [Pedobacter sp. Hv1]
MTESTPNQKSSFFRQMAIISMLFFVFGFVTWLNGTLIPFLQIACDLKETQALLVTFAFYMAYFFLAIPSSAILKKTGFKNGMALGLFVMALGSLIFIPAAQQRAFGLFLTGLFVQGAGLALLQTASNPYAAIIGPIESAAQRISILGICNKIAGAISPLILSAIVLKNATAIEEKIKVAVSEADKIQLLDELASKVITPYVIMAVVLMVLAFLIKKSSLPEIDTDKEDEGSGAETAHKSSVLSHPHLVLGVICLFLYVGVEVMAGDVIGNYGRAMGMSLDTTKYFTTFTLISMLVGYVIGIFAIPKYISQQTSLKLAAILGLVFTLGAYFTEGYTAVTFIALLGLANAPMWPAIFPLAINKLGRFTKIGSALLVMGIAGGAILPQIYAQLKSQFGMANNLAFLICMLPCYAYILYYAMAGYKAGLKK